MQSAILPNWWLQDEEGSTLTINNVSVSDSGNYSCQPRDLRADEVMVTILSERQAPDALQDKTTHSGDSASSLRQNYLGNWARPANLLIIQLQHRVPLVNIEVSTNIQWIFWKFK